VDLSGTTLVAAMSGGVDSSVAAALMQEAGATVIGVTLKMKTCDDSRERTKSCCGLDDNIQARMAAKTLGIPHYFHDVRDRFSEEILRHTWNEYHRGRTPNPCILCNARLKFGALLDYAHSLGATGVITGHYAILDPGEDGHNRLRRGLDDRKNQTYFLSQLTQDQLDHAYFPLGRMEKSKVRELAAERGLSNAEKTESQDACFGYADERFSTTLERLFAEGAVDGGEIITLDGTVVAHHSGIHNFTIGQRKGLGVAMGDPAYVTHIDGETQRVTISTNPNDLLKKSLTASGMNWLDRPGDEFPCMAQVRYQQRPVPATARVDGAGDLTLHFDEPVRAVTPGQAVVLYRDDQVLGGGWID
jgi:tRNA-specific 2-thiouridylase